MIHDYMIYNIYCKYIQYNYTFYNTCSQSFSSGITAGSVLSVHACVFAFTFPFFRFCLFFRFSALLCFFYHKISISFNPP